MQQTAAHSPGAGADANADADADTDAGEDTTTGDGTATATATATGTESGTRARARPRAKTRAGSLLRSTITDIRSIMPMYKFTACSRCHAKKIKCSGGKPCQGCLQNDAGDACLYPERNRTVKVTQRFLDSLCEEITQLRHQQQETARRSVNNDNGCNRNDNNNNDDDDDDDDNVHNNNNNNDEENIEINTHQPHRQPQQQPHPQSQQPGIASSNRGQGEPSRNNNDGHSEKSNSRVAGPAPASASASVSDAGPELGTEDMGMGIGMRMGMTPLSYTTTTTTTTSRGQGSWFDNRNVFQTPILIGETADAAFATRFRQTISNPQAPEPSHLLRLNYFSEEALMGLVQYPVSWPSPARARFLVEAALKYLARCHYLVQREVVMDVLGTGMLTQSGWGMPELRAKFWVLFALGELCSARSLPSDSYPGVQYYTQATKLLGQVNERPSLDSIEALLLLSLYSLALNRRHSAYIYVGNAMRSAVVMGLHLLVPREQLPDPFAREHRRRLFWTAYVYDRRWASLLNLPPAIQDSAIEVDYPNDSEQLELGSLDPPMDEGPGTFRRHSQSRSSTSSPNSEYNAAIIQLSSLLSGVVDSVYGLRNRPEDTQLPSRVYRALEDLQEWVGRLPPSLQINKPEHEEGRDSIEVVSLHLSFYQCVILATRLMLLYSLRVRAEQTALLRAGICADTDTAAPTIGVPASAVALSEACVRCARHSAYLLTQAWIEGSFATLDCFFTHYLFSSATILAISSLMGSKDSSSDRDAFEQAAGLLRQLQEAGNCVAQEYCHHIHIMEAAMATYQGNAEQLSNVDTASVVGGGGGDGGGGSTSGVNVNPFPTMDHMGTGTGTGSDMPWTEPSLQQLLSQPALDMQFLEAAVSNRFSQGLYWSDDR